MVNKKLERMTEKQMTAVLKKMFGDEYYALARLGYRRICRTFPGSLCVDMVSAKTWQDALAQAREAFGWTKDTAAIAGRRTA